MSCPHCKDKSDTRSIQQNNLAHWMFTDLEEQVLWNGQKLTKHTWKRLCTASYLRSVNEHAMLIPALDGHGIDIIYEKTSKMLVGPMAGLIEWTRFFGDSHRVMWSDKSHLGER